MSASPAIHGEVSERMGLRTQDTSLSIHGEDVDESFESHSLLSRMANHSSNSLPSTRLSESDFDFREDTEQKSKGDFHLRSLEVKDQIPCLNKRHNVLSFMFDSPNLQRNDDLGDSLPMQK